MPFHDLNIAYTQDHAALSNTLLFARELGYETVALYVAIAGKIPTPVPSIPVSAITNPGNLKILTRLNLTVLDAAQNYRLSSLVSSYDIVALRPTCQKTYDQCCHSLDCDVISFDFSQRLPFSLHKFTTAASALQRGVRFEICYSAGIVGGSDARRHLISAATQLIRVARGRGIIVSSEAKSVLGLRAPWDVINLAQVWGLPQQRAKEALCEETAKVVRLAGLKRTSFRGVVDIVDGGSDTAVSAKEKELQLNKSINRHQAKQTKTEAEDSRNEKTDYTTTTNGAKRKASEPLSNTTTHAQSTDGNLLSKSQRRKRAKKEKLEGKTVPGSNTVADKVSRGISS